MPQAEKAVDAFLASIKSTLWKHIPVNAQGPLIANALSMAFQFQMSVWCMIGKECVCPMQRSTQIGAAWLALSRP